MEMKIYRISQEENMDYDTYDSAIVVALNAEAAQRMHPDGRGLETFYYEDGRWEEVDWWRANSRWSTWAKKLESVTVEWIGTTDKFKEPCVLCASFNAG